MTEYMDALLTDEQKGFVVTDDQKAMWCINQIKDARTEEAKFVAFYQEQIKRVQENTANTVDRMQAMLLPYFQSVPRSVKKTQETYTLPGATLVLKHQDPEFKRDTDKLIPFLKKNAPQYVEVSTVTTETAKWGEYKKQTIVSGNKVIDKETGEVVDGVTVEARPDKFEVKIDA